ncbi:MAG: hypothetical protein AB7V77_03310 [Candidatus Woesearchaeota archaeon]
MNKTTTLLSFLLIFLISMPFISSEILISNPSQTSSDVVLDSENIDVIYVSMDRSFMVNLAESSVNICKCGSTSSSLTITNTGAFASKYFITSNKEYTTLSENEITLLPGESKQISMFYTASCFKFFNTNKIKFEVTSINGVSQEIIQKINFNKCQNLMVALSEESWDMKPCEETKTSTLTISNTAGFSETYDIYINNEMRDYVKFDKNIITLQGNTYTTLNVYFTPTCDMYGDYEAEITVKSRNNEKVATLIKNIHIERNYLFNTTLNQEKIEVCAGETTEFNMLVENQNNFENKFIFEIKKPSFIDFKFPEIDGKQSNSLLLENNSNTNIPLIINPTKRNIGNYEIKIQTTSQKGNIEKQLIIPVEVKNCYDFSLDIPKKDIYYCGTEDFTQEAIIKNKGTQDTKVGLVLYSPDFGRLEKTEMNILANNVENKVNINFNDAYNIKQTYAIILELYHKGELKTTDVMNLHLEDTITCFNVISKQDTIKITPDETSFELTIQNTGRKYGEYALEITNLPNYIDNNVQEISLGSSEKINLLFTIDEERLNEMITYNNGTAIGLKASPIITLTHTASNTTFVNQFSFEIVDYPWYQKTWNYVYAIPNCTLFLILISIAIVVFVVLLLIKFIGRKNTPMKFKSNKLFVISGIIVLLILGTFVFLNNEFPLTMPICPSTHTNINMYEGSSKLLGMNDYFMDEDGDIVDYIATFDNENLELSYLTSENNFTIFSSDKFGKTNMTLSAVDSYDEVAVSEPIKINVKEVKDYSGYELYSKLCPFFNLIALIILSILLYLFLSYRKLSKEEIKKIERKKLLEARKLEREKAKKAKSKTKK